MQFKQISDTCFYFDAPVNIGYVQHGDEGLLIDAGLDRSTMKKVINVLNQQSLPVTHLFITHAHADHYGGASYLQKEKHIYTIAPRFEAAILKHPVFEPLYLFGGNDPLPELRNKFLEGEPVRVDEEVDEGQYSIGSFQMTLYAAPGHSYHQMGVLIDNVYYAGDSYFGTEQLLKHKIPYITDAEATIESLKKIKQIECRGAVPGHGSFEEIFTETIQTNIDYHERLLKEILQYIEEKGEVSHEQIIADLCSKHGVRASQLSQFLLFRTAVTAYISALIQREAITHEIKNYRWVFRKA